MAVETERTGRDLQRAAANALRQQGRNYTQIAEILTINRKTARLWTSPEALRADREKRLRRRVAGPRVCKSALCLAVIAESESAQREYCGRSCQRRMAYLRKIGMA